MKYLPLKRESLQSMVSDLPATIFGEPWNCASPVTKHIIRWRRIALATASASSLVKIGRSVEKYSTLPTLEEPACPPKSACGLASPTISCFLIGSQPRQITFDTCAPVDKRGLNLSRMPSPPPHTALTPQSSTLRFLNSSVVSLTLIPKPRRAARCRMNSRLDMLCW